MSASTQTFHSMPGPGPVSSPMESCWVGLLGEVCVFFLLSSPWWMLISAGLKTAIPQSECAGFKPENKTQSGLLSLALHTIKARRLFFFLFSSLCCRAFPHSLKYETRKETNSGALWSRHALDSKKAKEDAHTLARGLWFINRAWHRQMSPVSPP